MSIIKDRIPKLGLVALSSYIADLFLVGVGEGEAIKHTRTRMTWHIFFFSILFFLLYHVIVRILIVPSIPNSPTTLSTIRLMEAFIYGYLLLTLGMLIYNHYHFMLLPRRDPRFVTIGFFFVFMTFLFSRLYYSLYHYNPALFRFSEATMIPTSEFGIHGYKDITAVTEFLVFSGCAMLNCSYSSIQSGSLIVSVIAFTQSLVGYIFAAILIATIVEISSLPSNKK